MSFDQKEPKALWSGRLSAEVDDLVLRYTRSLHVDRRLALYDLKGSEAHVRMLCRQGLLTREERNRILEGLREILAELETGSFPFREELEDIHMNVEQRLGEKIGGVAGKLHTGRSRNDQVSTDMRLFCLDSARRWSQALRKIISEIADRAEEYRSGLFPAWTHLQAAQPLSWGHYLLAFAEMFARDVERLDSYSRRHSVSPLGAGALSGSSLPLDPESTGKELGFSRSFGNSYDVAGDRDMVLELLQTAEQMMLHMSRLAEDFIYLASTPVSWIEIPDSLCTGSSMMPQKKNPDLLELLRGKTAMVLGQAHGMAVLLKGLPSSYHRDLQQDKEHLFPVVDILEDSLLVVSTLISRFLVREEKAAGALREGFLMATELAEYLVNRGVPFREAHNRVGALVRRCTEGNRRLEDLSLEEIQEVIPEAGADVQEVLQPDSVLVRRRHKGSTGLESIDLQLSRWHEWLGEE